MKYIIAKGKDEDANILKWHPESQVLVEMNPLQFLKLTPLLTNNTIRKNSLDNLINRLENNLSIDIPYLDLDIKTCEIQNHEGRHRALASYIVGLKKIPIIVYLRDSFKYVDKDTIDVDKICKIIKSQKCGLRDKHNYEIIF